MQGLTWLNLDKTTITDAGLADLAPLQNLKWMHIGSNNLTDACVDHVGQLKSLGELIITFNPGISTAGQEKLQAELPDCKIQF